MCDDNPQGPPTQYAVVIDSFDKLPAKSLDQRLIRAAALLPPVCAHDLPAFLRHDIVTSRIMGKKTTTRVFSLPRTPDIGDTDVRIEAWQVYDDHRPRDPKKGWEHVVEITLENIAEHYKRYGVIIGPPSRETRDNIPILEFLRNSKIPPIDLDSLESWLRDQNFHAERKFDIHLYGVDHFGAKKIVHGYVKVIHGYVSSQLDALIHDLLEPVLRDEETHD
jgi:hypothetical protein